MSKSGLGRLRGGNIRAAVNGPPHAWALGDGAGEDVEIFINQQTIEGIEGIAK